MHNTWTNGHLCARSKYLWHQVFNYTPRDATVWYHLSMSYIPVWSTQLLKQYVLYSFWPSDAIWWHRSGSTLVQLIDWRHKAITSTNVDVSSVRSSDIHLRIISKEISETSVTKISLKMSYLKFHSNLWGTNELKFAMAHNTKYILLPPMRTLTDVLLWRLFSSWRWGILSPDPLPLHCVCPAIRGNDRPISQIPVCNFFISQNAPFRTEMCTFLFWMEHSGIGNRCILGFVN